MFSAMLCKVVNSLILCATPVSTRYEVVLSRSTPYVMEGVTYHFIPSVSDKDVTTAVMGDWDKLTAMKGCKLTSDKKEFYYELPCDQLLKVLRATKCED